MITFSRLGGYGQLGNQMFQYAMLLGVKYKTGYEIVLPSHMADFPIFKYFKMEDFKIGSVKDCHEYNEPFFHYDAGVFNLGDNIDYAGYFQSEKYFAHCKNIVRKEFQFSRSLRFTARCIIDHQYVGHTVSVHVRRGDYLAYPDHHPLPSVEYYNSAMDLFDEGSTQFMFCSDDIQWCKETFKRPNIYFSEHNAAEDLAIIANCDEHIIANSSFSWWGSWLSQCPGCAPIRIVAPKQWFGPAYEHWDTKDIYTDNMIKL